MPEEMERRLIREARERGWYKKKESKRKGKTILTERGRRYVYGAMRQTGWKPSREE